MTSKSILMKFGCAVIASTVLILISPKSHAYFATIDTGEMIEPEKYQAVFEPQLIFNRYEGTNFSGRFDVGLTEESSIRGILGFGKVDFQLGGLYKFIPFPDTAKQPAMGGEVGLLFARVAGQTEVSLRVHPLISKRFETEMGDLVPYASLPLGITWRTDETVMPVQIVGGTEIRPLTMPKISFFAELGVNLNKSFSYIAGAIAYRFDEAALRSR